VTNANVHAWLQERVYFLLRTHPTSEAHHHLPCAEWRGPVLTVNGIDTGGL